MVAMRRNRDKLITDFLQAFHAAAALPAVQQASMQWPALAEQPTGPEIAAAAAEAVGLLQSLTASHAGQSSIVR